MFKVEIKEVTTVTEMQREWQRLRAQTDRESKQGLSDVATLGPETGYVETPKEVTRERVLLLQFLDSVDLAAVIRAINFPETGR